MRLRAERTAQGLRDQAAEARRIVTEERARIARELHDVVAHRVSLMTTSRILAQADWPVRVLILTTFDPDEYVGLRDRTQIVVFAYESGLVKAGDHDIGQ